MKEKNDTTISYHRILQDIAAESSVGIQTSPDGLSITFSFGEDDAALQFKLRGTDLGGHERGELEPTVESWHYRKYAWFREVVQKMESKRGAEVTLLPTSLVHAGIDAGLEERSIVDFTKVVNGLLVKPDFARCINETKDIFSKVAQDYFPEDGDFQVWELEGTYRLIPVTPTALESLKIENDTYREALPNVKQLHEKLRSELSTLV